ncbi:hypothetical protein [Actinomadura keratinilytica]|uniref:Cwf19-like C-terminal domain-containing protein n=1 Tax=Actinomadura keratinilytica TaxID=547461 RepID=A0ABP7Y1W8_9ACTN
MAEPAMRTDPRTDPRADCVLCPPLRFRFNAMADLPGHDCVLAADDAFLLMPDLAPLTDGHLLLVTTGHHQCAAAFSASLFGRALRWRRHVALLYTAAYGAADMLVMEHGPGSPQGGGACIDHAHWHMLPTTASVRAVLEEQGLRGRAATHRALRACFRARRSYLLVEERGHSVMYPADGVPRQYLRWAAAVALGRRTGGTAPDVWRWQEMFGLPDSRARFLRTLDAMRAAVAATGPHGAGQRLPGAPPPERNDSHQ